LINSGCRKSRKADSWKTVLGKRGQKLGGKDKFARAVRRRKEEKKGGDRQSSRPSTEVKKKCRAGKREKAGCESLQRE